MFMVANSLRIGVVTGHIPIANVASSISIEKVLKKIDQIDNSLKSDFNIRRPKIAVLGLNPHSGDNIIKQVATAKMVGLNCSLKPVHI